MPGSALVFEVVAPMMLSDYPSEMWGPSLIVGID